MAAYQICYDLRKQKDYASLIERIKTYGTWCKPLESTWIVVTHHTAVQVRDYLTAVMDSDDGLLVTHLQGEAAGSGFAGDVSAWMRKNV